MKTTPQAVYVDKAERECAWFGKSSNVPLGYAWLMTIVLEIWFALATGTFHRLP